MSCDFLVFETDAAPRDRKAFMAWFERLTDWEDDDSWQLPTTSSSGLRAWYQDMIPHFPPLNGPDAAPADDENPRLADYNFTPSGIYVGFRWSEADEASETCKRLAFEHGLGFFDPQSDADGIYFPDLPDGGQLKSSKPWWMRLFSG